MNVTWCVRAMKYNVCTVCVLYIVWAITAQLKTSARMDAEKDPRNSFAMAEMIEAFCKHLSPAMVFNWDATQYALSPDKDEV